MTEKTTNKRGRPIGYRAKNSANKVLPTIRVTEQQLNDYKKAADQSGQTFSAWVKNALDQLIK